MVAWITARLSGQAVDDFYITYRYAQNLAAGHGFVFNPGERVFGLTDPGIGLLLGFLHAATRLPIPFLGTAVTGAAIAGIALVLLRAAQRTGRTAEALVGGTLAVTSSYLWVNQGAGVFLALLLLLLAAEAGDRSPALAGLLAGGAVWMRPDAMVGLLLLGLLFWAEKRRIPWLYALMAGAVAALGGGAAWLYFGHPMPNTLAAKAAMAAANANSWSAERFWARSFPLLRRHWGPAWAWIVAAGVAGQAFLVWKGGRAGRLLALFSAGLAVAYPLLRVPFFFWYTVPTGFALLYGVPFLAGGAGRAVSAALPGKPAARWAGAAASAIAAAVLVPLLLSLVPASARWHRIYRWPRHLESYQKAALWIRDRSEPGDAIAYVEIGVLAYYSDRPIVDLMGLVTPGAIPYVAKGDLPGAFLAHPTRFVLHHSRGGMARLFQRRWFWNAYEPVVSIPEKDGGEIRVFERRDGSALPPPRAPGARGHGGRTGGKADRLPVPGAGRANP